MMLLTQKLGWAQGWSTIIRILANAPAVLHSSSNVLDQVESGVFLGSFAVNFDGLARADASEGAVEYINPPAAIAVTPDVTSALKTAHDVTLVQDFVRYCLSDAGQLAWGGKASAHGLTNAALYHYPIVPRIYEQKSADLAILENPLTTDFGLKMNLERSHRLNTALAPLIHAATEGENHIRLQQAWAAVIAAGMPAEAVRELTSLPFDEDVAFDLGVKYRGADEAQAGEIIADWTRMFSEKYARVMELAK